MNAENLHPQLTKKYRSGLRASLRFVLQRILFRGVLRSAISPSVSLDPSVRALNGGYLLVANHTSHLDAPIIAQSLPRKQARFLATGVAHDYFFTVWYRKLFVRWLFNAFPVHRGGSHGSSSTPRALLRAEVPVLLFPEGGRQTDGLVADFKVGAIRLAADAGVPIVPAAVVGGLEAMPKGSGWPRPGRPPVRVVFGEVLLPEAGESLASLTSRVQRHVADLYGAGAADIAVPGLRGRARDSTASEDDSGRPRSDQRHTVTDGHTVTYGRSVTDGHSVTDGRNVTDEGMKN
ncbi:MAG: lysophospholipid acyltransferase family protein [Brevibacterium sp.]